MKVGDVMTRDVVTARPETPVSELARTLIEHRISGVPIVDPDGALIGLVSEGDLILRAEIGAKTRRSWWLDLLVDSEQKSADYLREHGKAAADVMTRDVVTTTEDASLGDTARLLEKHRIKRLPVIRSGRIVGIVSRANVLRGLATAEPEMPTVAVDDQEIRAAVLRSLSEAGAVSGYIDATVRDGVVELWGAARSEAEEKAAIVAAETAPGVRRVENHVGRVEPWAWGY